ncbi:MAG: nucleotidyltransferase [Massilibacteroides sp.]|nr:nucleotidyltransferase [Massilibacteroides sp.]MDD3063498.1 nucleotidyltransferase [Massilibacteroides sp.]MDD4115906.1 nucleotidyltransferase [Massilibacteroides sp.]MDD4660885.1 nucleotidyltransferase [Massilibacteroides sp.]
MIEEKFIEFLDNITLSSSQSNDAQTKYTGVCEKLYSKYYEGTYDESKKYLFGSYKTKTNISPLSEFQDVDVLFKIPQTIYDKFDQYESNGQSALLQEVRICLEEKYSTTKEIKAWGKVVLVKFAENHHNVELLPALELDDNTFKIPNSENGGSWEIFDPKKEIDKFQESNKSTNRLTRQLTKMIKSWGRSIFTLSYKSFEILNDVISFTDEFYESGKGETSYAKIVFDFFDYKKNNIADDDESKSHIDTAYNRAQKALEYADNDKPKEASIEWQKIFGAQFPLIKENPQKKSESREIQNPASPWLY